MQGHPPCEHRRCGDTVLSRLSCTSLQVENGQYARSDTRALIFSRILACGVQNNNLCNEFTEHLQPFYQPYHPADVTFTRQCLPLATVLMRSDSDCVTSPKASWSDVQQRYLPAGSIWPFAYKAQTG
jgi:hypothetical protein